MPKTPYPQGPPRVEASGSGRTNLQIDHEEITDAAKQSRPELDLRRNSHNRVLGNSVAKWRRPSTREEPSMPKSRTQFAAVCPRPSTPRLTLSIPEFCEAHGISEGFFYKLKKQGEGPREMRGGQMPVVAIPGNRERAAIRRGPTLHLQHIGGRRRLSNGQTIHAAVANVVISNASVEPASNDALFPDLLAQTWRMK